MLVALNIKSPKSKPIFLPFKRESNRKVFRFLPLNHKLFIIAVDPKPLFYNYAIISFTKGKFSTLCDFGKSNTLKIHMHIINRNIIENCRLWSIDVARKKLELTIVSYDRIDTIYKHTISYKIIL